MCTDPKAWCYTYADPLQEMYRVTRLIIKAKYPYTKIDWDDPIYANALSKMIYIEDILRKLEETGGAEDIGDLSAVQKEVLTCLGLLSSA